MKRFFAGTVLFAALAGAAHAADVTLLNVSYDPTRAFVRHFVGESLAVPVTIEAGGVHLAGRRLDLDAQGLSNGEASLSSGLTRSPSSSIPPAPCSTAW
jgi:opacity protein-like surface antigen